MAKKILFLHINFYEYDKKIMLKMSELGYEVDFFCIDIKSNVLEKIIYRLSSKYIKLKTAKMRKEVMHNITRQQKTYDFIFVIKGDKLTKKFLDKLRKLNPCACFILYQWDDVKRVSNFFETKEFYNKIFTFDNIDAQKYKLFFLPLFFCDEYINTNTAKKIDAYFSGIIHSNRKQFIEKVFQILTNANMKVYFHLLMTYRRNLFNKIKNLDFKKTPNYIKHTKLTLQQNAQLTKESKILIDLHHPTQKGLTMRTMEALAAKAKLITTNDEIVKYDFYNYQNILIVDAENPVIPINFLESPYKDISEDIIRKYSLENWVKTIFSDTLD